MILPRIRSVYSDVSMFSRGIFIPFPRIFIKVLIALNITSENSKQDILFENAIQDKMTTPNQINNGNNNLIANYIPKYDKKNT